jgi:membrane fusion protein (multidrug efflux system)
MSADATPDPARDTQPAPPDVPQAAVPNPRRRKALVAILGVCILALAGYGTYWLLVLRYRQSTDDAYVDGNVVQITSQVPGTVVAIHADDTQFVPAGRTLVELDPADARIALEHSEADLGKTVREVRELFATSAQLDAMVKVQESNVTRAQDDLGRRQRLAASGAVSGEELQHAREALRSAEAGLAAAREKLAATRARIDRTSIPSHPEVEAAAARVREAYLAYARTTIPAPVAGIVAKRSVQVGQRVSAGTPLMAVVPLDDVWVDANFKENQLRSIRKGQPVRLTADANGFEYHGTVAGFGAGTGSAFALLPAQNATGNWIKVVQRLPVRIALDHRELEAHPLQVGLSMEVDVDVHDRAGGPLAPGIDPGYHTDVYAEQQRGLDAPVARIIARNLGTEAMAARPSSARHLSSESARADQDAR